MSSRVFSTSENLMWFCLVIPKVKSLLFSLMNFTFSPATFISFGRNSLSFRMKVVSKYSWVSPLSLRLV